jgi:hypothetical protein
MKRFFVYILASERKESGLEDAADRKGKSDLVRSV